MYGIQGLPDLSGLNQLANIVKANPVYSFLQGAIPAVYEQVPSSAVSVPATSGFGSDELWNLVVRAFSHPKVTPALINQGLQLITNALTQALTMKQLQNQAYGATLKAIDDQMESIYQRLTLGATPEERALLKGRLMDLQEQKQTLIQSMFPQLSKVQSSQALPVQPQSNETSKPRKNVMGRYFDVGKSTVAIPMETLLP